jgi:hypothetical protein
VALSFLYRLVRRFAESIRIHQMDSMEKGRRDPCAAPSAGRAPAPGRPSPVHLVRSSALQCLRNGTANPVASRPTSASPPSPLEMENLSGVTSAYLAGATALVLASKHSTHQPTVRSLRLETLLCLERQGAPQQSQSAPDQGELRPPIRGKQGLRQDSRLLKRGPPARGECRVRLVDTRFR